MTSNTPLMGNSVNVKGKGRTWCVTLIGFVMMATPTFLGIHNIMPNDVVSKPEAAQVEMVATTTNTSTSQCVANPHRVVPYIGSECDTNSHYCLNPDTGNISWEPVPKCYLPPPQPYWLEGSGTLFKGVGMGVVFYTKISQDPLSNMDKNKERAIIAFTLGGAFVSILLLAFKAWNMETDSYWEHFQCAGVIFSMAPWSANILLYVAKMFAAMSLSRATGGNRGADKEALCNGIIAVTAGAFALLNGLFTVTNLVPGAIAYLWVPVPTMALFMKAFEAMNKNHLERGGPTERTINLGPMMMIPVAILVDLTIQWLATTSVYLYQDMGYFQAAWTSTTERQSSIYFQNVINQVLLQAPWAAELVNEVAP